MRLNSSTLHPLFRLFAYLVLIIGCLTNKVLLHGFAAAEHWMNRMAWSGGEHHAKEPYSLKW